MPVLTDNLATCAGVLLASRSGDAIDQAQGVERWRAKALQRAADTATSRSAVIILTSTATPTPSPATSCQRSSFWMRYFMT